MSEYRNYGSTLKKLLEVLSEKTNYCPMCDGEYVHNGDYSLDELWTFNRINLDISNENWWVENEEV